MPPKRSDRTGSNRTIFEKNARYIYKTQGVCGICGLPVDMELKSPDPMSKTIDHIIPVSKGGHPSDLSNLQLAHRCCNRQKGDKLFTMTAVGGYGFKNSGAVYNNPGIFKNPGGQETRKNPRRPEDPKSPRRPAAAENRTTGESRDSNEARCVKKPVDNNDLPQHADWDTLVW